MRSELLLYGLGVLLRALFAVLFLVGLAESGDQIRIDLYDKHSHRQGYQILDLQTGRIDTYDRFSNRKGYGTITGPRGSAPTDSGRSTWSTAPGSGRSGSGTGRGR